MKEKIEKTSIDKINDEFKKYFLRGERNVTYIDRNLSKSEER